MASSADVVIVGASARAAAFSALRAGLRPRCADLFADRDLQAVCPVVRVAPADYPNALADVLNNEWPGPWLYTGALENHPALVTGMAQRRPLWGNDGGPVSLAQAPETLASYLGYFDLPRPRVLQKEYPPEYGPERWLAKPVYGAGGAGVRFWDGVRRGKMPRRVYFQEYLEGTPCSAVYVGGTGRRLLGVGHALWLGLTRNTDAQVLLGANGVAGGRLLGVTRQLIGEPWLNAAPFQYCGNVGPLPVNWRQLRLLRRLGDALPLLGLRGLFGVDFILRDRVPYPIEVNPRYTASVEVLEYATGMQALGWHRLAFEATAPRPGAGRTAATVVGKAIFYARRRFAFPDDGPWMTTLRQSQPWTELPEFADIPHPGEILDGGRPVLTFFARAATVDDCVDRLRAIAGELDRRLFEP
jgi:uncharacterized protein